MRAHHPLTLGAPFLAAANPRPRLGMSFKLPVVFAGNKDAREDVKTALAEKAELHVTSNLRPVLEREDLTPARNEPPPSGTGPLPVSSVARMLKLVVVPTDEPDTLPLTRRRLPAAVMVMVVERRSVNVL